MKGLLLGLANGTVCLAYCAPVIIPYLLGEGQRVRQNFLDLGQFLIGRLIGYLFFAVLAWALGLLVAGFNGYRETLFGASYVLLAISLVYYCFRKPKKLCAAEYLKGFSKFFTVNRFFFPLTLGLLTGLNLCPPFLLAFTSAVLEGNLWGSLVFFSAFFLGTSLYFVPIPLLGLVKRNDVVRNIGKMAAGVIGAYYLYLGIIILLGGIEKL